MYIFACGGGLSQTAGAFLSSRGKSAVSGACVKCTKLNIFFNTYLIRYIGQTVKRGRVQLFFNLPVNINSTEDCKKGFFCGKGRKKYQELHLEVGDSHAGVRLGDDYMLG